MLVMSLCLVSCGGDDDEDINNGGSNGDNTEIKGDYTATTSVKTVTLTASYVEGQPTTGIKIYEDFNNLYSLVLSGGSLCFPHYGRSNGQWSAYIFKQDTETGIKDIGKVTSLQDIKIKIIMKMIIDIAPTALLFILIIPRSNPIMAMLHISRQKTMKLKTCVFS